MGLLLLAVAAALVLLVLMALVAAVVALVLYLSVKYTLVLVLLVATYKFVQRQRAMCAKGFYTCARVPTSSAQCVIKPELTLPASPLARARAASSARSPKAPNSPSEPNAEAGPEADEHVMTGKAGNDGAASKVVERTASAPAMNVSPKAPMSGRLASAPMLLPPLKRNLMAKTTSTAVKVASEALPATTRKQSEEDIWVGDYREHRQPVPQRSYRTLYRTQAV